MTSVQGLVLAGGRGRRLGRPKAGLVLAGRTLVERAVDLVSYRCDRVVVVSRPEVPLPVMDVEVVHDQAGVTGPMNALAAGLRALDGEHVLVLACDLPLAGPVLDRLLEVPLPASAVAVDGVGVQPLCARYPRRPALAAVEELMADDVLRMSTLVEHLDAITVEAGADELLNVNHPADLDRFMKASGNLLAP